MQIEYTVYYVDGSSSIISINKPAGAHPDSPVSLYEGVIQAEKTGKTVEKIGRSQFYRGKILSDLLDRSYIINNMKRNTGYEHIK